MHMQTHLATIAHIERFPCMNIWEVPSAFVYKHVSDHTFEAMCLHAISCTYILNFTIASTFFFQF